MMLLSTGSAVFELGKTVSRERYHCTERHWRSSLYIPGRPLLPREDDSAVQHDPRPPWSHDRGGASQRKDEGVPGRSPSRKGALRKKYWLRMSGYWHIRNAIQGADVLVIEGDKLGADIFGNISKKIEFNIVVLFHCLRGSILSHLRQYILKLNKCIWKIWFIKDYYCLVQQDCADLMDL